MTISKEKNAEAVKKSRELRTVMTGEERITLYIHPLDKQDIIDFAKKKRMERRKKMGISWGRE